MNRLITIILGLIGLALLSSCGTGNVSITQLDTVAGKTPLIILSNKTLNVKITPELGGKVIAIQDAKGFNYLSRSKRPYIKRHSKMTYKDTEFDGIDECFMTIAPCQYPDGERKGQKVPDHGPLPYKKWEMIEGQGVMLNVEMPEWSLRLQRQILLVNNAVIFKYDLQNVGAEDIHFIYAFHPLFAATTGTKIHWPDATPIMTSYSTGNFLKKQGNVIRWDSIKTADGTLFKDQQFTNNSKRYYKYFATDKELRQVTLSHPDQKSLTLRWDRRFTPYAAVWCSEGNVDGLHHIGIEPTTAPYDSLSKAYNDKRSTRILAGETLSWAFSIRIH